MAESNRSFGGFFPEALILAILTAVAYWFAFLYELAYLGFFDLPPDLVEVSLRTILWTTLALCGAWSVFWPINIGSMLWPENPAIKRKIFPSLVALFVLIWWLAIYGFRIKDWTVYVVCLFIAVIGTAVQFLPDRGPEPPTIIDRIGVVFGRAAAFAVLGVFALLVIGSFLAFTLGQAKAETKKHYFIFGDYPEIAIIRIYSDRILAIPIDRKSKTFRPELIIRKIDQEDIRLTLEQNVGPLTKP